MPDIIVILPWLSRWSLVCEN